MNDSIFSTAQKRFLKIFAQDKPIAEQFYLSGGTALAGFYIPYRYSEDLDFFSEHEIDLESIWVFLKSRRTQIGYTDLDLNTSYNRNLFFLRFSKSVLKTEFTYYPFLQVLPPKVEDGIKIDSVIDIAVNKVFTIYQKPRCRDFLDLFMIHQQFGYDFSELMKKARAKFDWHIDPIKMGSQLMLVTELKDYPNLIEKVTDGWQEYFIEIAKSLEPSILGEQLKNKKN